MSWDHSDNTVLTNLAVEAGEANRHLADIADSLRKIAQAIEVTIAIEGGSSVPPLPATKGEPS